MTEEMKPKPGCCCCLGSWGQVSLLGLSRGHLLNLLFDWALYTMLTIPPSWKPSLLETPTPACFVPVKLKLTVPRSAPPWFQSQRVSASW